MTAPTHATILTAPGRSAVAVVAVAGADALRAVDACFLPANGKPLAGQPVDAIRFGRWANDAGEEVVVCRRSQQQVEVHCHGGAAAVRGVVDLLVQQGCVEQPWQTASRSAGTCRVDQEAAEALRQAPTERTAAIALDQVEGAMTSKIRELLDIESSELLATQLAQLLNWAPIGRHLTRPWRVVLAGAPNVGKSSLINALLGFERVIVFDQPGTTRDAVAAAAAIDGWPVTLTDTAGLRDASDAVEAAGVQLARHAVAGADLVVEVRDASQPQDTDGLPADRLIVWNKTDLARPPDGWQGVATSAATHAGVDALLAAIAARLIPSPPQPQQAVPLSSWQADQLKHAQQQAEQGDLAGARATLQAMLAPRGS